MRVRQSYNPQELTKGTAQTQGLSYQQLVVWMQIMGRILGIKRASELGDYIAGVGSRNESLKEEAEKASNK